MVLLAVHVLDRESAVMVSPLLLVIIVKVADVVTDPPAWVPWVLTVTGPEVKMVAGP